MLELLTLQDLGVKFLAFDSESTHELFWRDKPTANRYRPFREQETAILTEGLAGLRVGHSQRVFAWRGLIYVQELVFSLQSRIDAPVLVMQSRRQDRDRLAGSTVTLSRFGFLLESLNFLVKQGDSRLYVGPRCVTVRYRNQVGFELLKHLDLLCR